MVRFGRVICGLRQNRRPRFANGNPPTRCAKLRPVMRTPSISFPLFLLLSCLQTVSLCGTLLSLGALPAFGQRAAVLPPLRTEGRRIVDSTGHPVRLASVNWYGFDQKEFVAGGLDHAPLEAIIAQIREIGVNSVRLPWANETLEHDPVAPDYAVAANPQLKGKRAMAIMDAVIEALARAHILVIL